MTVKIDKKIVGYKVGGNEAEQDVPATGAADGNTSGEAQHEGNIVRMHEKLERP